MHEYYKKIYGYISDKEVESLQERVNSLPEKSVIVEIGSFMGKSTVAMAEVAESRGISIFAIDPFIGSNLREQIIVKSKVGEREYKFIEDKRTVDEYYDPYIDYQKNIGPFQHVISTLKLRSEEAVKIWKKPIDMIFIDGDHSYKAVKHDIESWMPFVKKGGVMAFHDYGNVCGGVILAVDELVFDRYESYTLVGDLISGRLKA